MTSSAFTESTVEEAALAWLEAIGWRIVHGPDIAPDTLAAERRDYGEVVLAQRLRDALARLNPDLPCLRARPLPARTGNRAYAVGGSGLSIVWLPDLQSADHKPCN